ncbi:hypothetical protein [Puerhibacterium puerhi]|uniref:hypothetical protein n=1 Tax=Puerhibacterium puerhi TaxID=2692623 RepID=UPI0013595021|nr:hypothetical protein [Puerhibacterium puerhi]
MIWQQWVLIAFFVWDVILAGVILTLAALSAKVSGRPIARTRFYLAAAFGILLNLSLIAVTLSI